MDQQFQSKMQGNNMHYEHADATRHQPSENLRGRVMYIFSGIIKNVITLCLLDGIQFSFPNTIFDFVECRGSFVVSWKFLTLNKYGAIWCVVTAIIPQDLSSSENLFIHKNLHCYCYLPYLSVFVLVESQ